MSQSHAVMNDKGNKFNSYPNRVNATQYNNTPTTKINNQYSKPSMINTRQRSVGGPGAQTAPADVKIRR